MAKVENVGGIYANLGYNYDDPNGNVNELSANTKASLANTPAFITTWQANDIATANTGGYLRNPVSNAANTMSSHSANIYNQIITANGLSGSTGTITNLFSSMANTCNDITGYTYQVGEYPPTTVTVEGEISKFLKHTNRLCGLRNYVDDVRADPNAAETKPYKDTAIAYGKQVMYIVNQTDDITNTSPILGSFTSLMCEPQLTGLNVIISTHAGTINSSITYTSTIDGEGNTYVTAASNLSLSVVSQMYSDITNCKSILVTRRGHDENYFTNMKTFASRFDETKRFVNMGESETHLVENLIGTDKLLERIG